MSGNELDALASLPPKQKQAPSASILNQWVRQAAAKGEVSEPRLGWLVASSVVLGALQQVADEDGRARFLLKGGTMLMHRLGSAARPTKDVDGILHGDITTFMSSLDAVLAQNWDPLTLTRTDARTFQVPHMTVLPRRFDIKIVLKGRVWRSIRVEISPDEGEATAEYDVIAIPSLQAVGLTAPGELACLTLRYQIAQKVHASTDPHEPPGQRNERARDIVDLLALIRLADSSGSPSPSEIAQACRDIFAARADRAITAGAEPRTWPPVFTAYAHWEEDYQTAAAAGSVNDLPLAGAITLLNDWLRSLP